MIITACEILLYSIYFRSFNRAPRYEKLNNTQPLDGPEIDTWTNETAADTNASKDTGLLTSFPNVSLFGP